MNPSHSPSRSKPLTATLATLVLAGCAGLPTPELDDIAETWAFAREHQQYDHEDSRDVRYVADPHAACIAAGVPAALLTRIVGGSVVVEGCTVLDGPVYSIVGLVPSALTLAHEATHRRYGSWHHGYLYFTSSQLALIGARQ